MNRHRGDTEMSWGLRPRFGDIWDWGQLGFGDIWDLGTFEIGDSTWGPRCGSATAPAVLGQQQSLCQPPGLPRICLEEQRREMQNSCCQLLPEALGYEKPIGDLVLGESQTFNSAAAICEEEKVSLVLVVEQDAFGILEEKGFASPTGG